MQPHVEVLLKEGAEYLLVVVYCLWVLNLFLTRFLLLAVIRASAAFTTRTWRLELILIVQVSFIGLRLGYGWINSELDGHLIVVGEDCHRLLVAHDEVEKCGDQLPRLELMRLVIDCYGIHVGHESAISIIRV